jgi:hypothetical protein
MENESNLILQNQKYSSMIRPTMGVSIIPPFILDVVEKLGKYELIYDYRVYNPIFDNMVYNDLLLHRKSTLIPENTPPVFYNFLPSESYIQAVEMAKREQAIASAMQNVAIAPRENINTGAIMPYVSYTVNPNPQVGTFSKGNVVNVIRFEGNIAVVENPNYILPNTTAPKVSFWTSLAGNMINQKEFKIPKEYLSKVDDNTPVTVSTGINFGANPKSQTFFQIPTDPNVISINPKIIPEKIIPELDNEVVLEKNATFVLNKDYKYRENSYCPPNAKCMQPPELIINSGTKVTGRLIRKNTYNYEFKVKKGLTEIPSYNDFLEIKGKGTGLINIPIEYLTREIQNTTSNNGRTPVSVIALVDKKRGKCNTDGALIQNMQYDPCRVSAIKGQIYNGYIVGNNFFDGKDASLSVNEYQIIPQNSGTVVPAKNNNKNLLMIAGAFLAGYIIFGNSKSSN